MMAPLFQVMNTKSIFLIKLRRIHFINNPKTYPKQIEEYSFENVPKNGDFHKKYLLLDRFICLLKI